VSDKRGSKDIALSALAHFEKQFTKAALVACHHCSIFVDINTTLMVPIGYNAFVPVRHSPAQLGDRIEIGVEGYDSSLKLTTACSSVDETDTT
jgi:hypothetical protein